jgi:uncharacterized protein YdeI (YjbR/CyaY-like superfamily)
VVRHIFQACPVWIYTQSNITSIIIRLLLSLCEIWISPVTFWLHTKYKLCCGWKAVGLMFVSGYICKIEPDTQVRTLATNIPMKVLRSKRRSSPCIF